MRRPQGWNAEDHRFTTNASEIVRGLIGALGWLMGMRPLERRFLEQLRVAR